MKLTLFNPNLDYERPKEHLQASLVPENRSQYAAQATDLCVHDSTDPLADLGDTLGSSAVRTGRGEGGRRGSSSYHYGLSNSSLALPNLESFLTENQIESSV